MASFLNTPKPPKIYEVPHEVSIAVLAALMMFQPSVDATVAPTKSPYTWIMLTKINKINIILSLFFENN